MLHIRSNSEECIVMLKISLSCPVSSAVRSKSFGIVTEFCLQKLYRLLVFLKMWMVPCPDEHMKPLEYDMMVETRLVLLEGVLYTC